MTNLNINVNAQPNALDSIPELLSNININIDLNNDSDFLFFAPYYNSGYAIILNSENEVVYYKYVGGYGARDFKMHPNGMMSYLSGESNHFIILNNELEVVDSVQCENNLETDFHDFKILDDGSYCLLCRGVDTKDFSALGGAVIHQVVDPIIQIQDSLKQVTYQWHAAPNFEGDYIIDILNNFNPNGSLKSFIHLNSIDIDAIGNFLISSRFQSQVSYVDRTTGEILWRLGGKQNEFTFLNDEGFSDQHSAKWTGENSILLFDNQCFADLSYSRAVEYTLDIANKTVTKIFEFVRTDSIHAQIMGNTQRLPNGNTLTSWGDTGLKPLQIIEVNTNGDIVFDLSLDSLLYTYSAYKFSWPEVDTISTTITPIETPIFQVYPNPSSNYFQVKINEALKAGEIEIQNLQGKTLYSKAFSGKDLIIQNDFPSGQYFVILYEDHQVIDIKHLLIK